MRVGVHQVAFGFPDAPASIGPTLAALGAAAEDVGLDNISVMDHYFQLPGFGLDPGEPMLEGYTTLGFLAAHTRTVELQLLVTGVTYRQPGLLAKIVTTLDVLSGGRAVLGIGAAWYEREHEAMGVPFPPVAERFERLEETLQVVHQMWSTDDGPYQGRHYRLAETMCSPPPVRRPHPPIMVGGGGERKTLRLVAQYADACNLFAGPRVGVDGVRAKLDVLRAHCGDVGRDYDEIRRTILYAATLDPTSATAGAAFVDEMAAYADLGVSEVHVMPYAADPVAFVRGLGEHVLPRLHEMR
jgi:F420-dependent oxidoreductase-like protein